MESVGSSSPNTRIPADKSWVKAPFPLGKLVMFLIHECQIMAINVSKKILKTPLQSVTEINLTSKFGIKGDSNPTLTVIS